MENDYVLIVEPIYPRPDTLKQLDAALKESYNWPKPRSKERNRRATTNANGDEFCAFDAR